MQRFGAAVLIGVVALSLVSSGLIVWLYVGRNLIARLTGLSDSMLAIAGGNLRAPLPPAGGRDEIGRMAEALTVFRDTAVEVEEKNLRDLHALLETIDYGVVMLDPDLRVRLHNRAFRELSGVPAEDLAGAAAFSRRAREHPAARDLQRAPMPTGTTMRPGASRRSGRRRRRPPSCGSPTAGILEYRCVPLLRTADAC